MFRRTKVCSGVLVALGGALSLGSAPVFGQQTFERVEITGSSVRRVDAEGALPVTVLKKEDIARTGATSVVDLLQKLPTVQGSTTESASVGGGSFGFSGISIHNIGETRTLVLLNGHRLSQFGGQTLTGFGAGDGPELDPDLGDRARRDPDRRRLGPVWRGRHRRRGQLHHQARHDGRRHHRRPLLSAGRRRRGEALQHLEGLRLARQGRLQRLTARTATTSARSSSRRIATSRSTGKVFFSNNGQNYRFQQFSTQPDSGQRDRRPRPPGQPVSHRPPASARRTRSASPDTAS